MGPEAYHELNRWGAMDAVTFRLFTIVAPWCTRSDQISRDAKKTSQRIDAQCIFVFCNKCCSGSLREVQEILGSRLL